MSSGMIKNTLIIIMIILSGTIVVGALSLNSVQEAVLPESGTPVIANRSIVMGVVSEIPSQNKIIIEVYEAQDIEGFFNLFKLREGSEIEVIVESTEDIILGSKVRMEAEILAGYRGSNIEVIE